MNVVSAAIEDKLYGKWLVCCHLMAVQQSWRECVYYCNRRH